MALARRPWGEDPMQDVLATATAALTARSCIVAVAELQQWLPWLGEAWSLLDHGERVRVCRRRIPADRQALAITYALHRLLLASVLDAAPADVPIGRDEQGAPCLPGMELRTSLSHADGVAAFALCTMGPVGVDIEPIERAGVMPEIAARVGHPDELQAMQRMGEAARGRSLLGLWVRKEAVLKAEGIGLARAMESFSAAAGDVLPLTRPERGAVRVSMLDVEPRWLAAVAAPPDAEVECIRLRPRLGRLHRARALYVS